MQAVGVGHHQLARRDLAHELGSHQIERAGLRSEDPIVMDSSDYEWTEAMCVAEADEPPLRQGDDRVGAREPAHRVRDRLLERCLVVRDQRRDQLAVGRGPEWDAGLAQLLAQLSHIDQVPVVPECDGARAPVLDERLRVRPLRGTGCRVAVMADRHLAPQAAELLLVEDLRDEPEVAKPRQPAVLGDGDSGRLLPAMLESEEAEVGQTRNVAVGRVNAEDTTHG
jgi:hypothetical protein